MKPPSSDSLRRYRDLSIGAAIGFLWSYDYHFALAGALIVLANNLNQRAQSKDLLDNLRETMQNTKP